MNLGKLLEDEGQLGVQVVEGIGLALLTISRSNSSVGTLLPPMFTEITLPVVLLNLIFVASESFLFVPSRIRSSPSAFQEPIIGLSSDLGVTVTPRKEPSAFNVELNTPPCVPGSDIMYCPESSVCFDDFNSGLVSDAGVEFSNLPHPTSTTAVIVVIRYFMDVFFVMRRSLLFKPSRTGRRAAKASSTAGSPDELKILNMTYKVIFSQQEQISFNCSDSRSTILYAATGSVMLKTNAAPMWRFEIAGMGDRFTVNQHLRSRPTIKDLQ